MSRNGAGVYSLPPSYLAETGDTILADQHNSPLEDLQTDANTPRPIVAGGTGASSAVSARTNLSVMSVADIQSGYVPKVATKAALSALDTASFKAAVLTETTREKLWMWKSGDFSAEEAADTDNVNYIPADGVSTSLGCWVAATGDGVTVRTIAAGGTGADNAADARTNLGLKIGTDVQAHSAVLDATTASFTTAQKTKLSGIETGADVTSATNVNAAGAVMNTDTATTDMQFVIDEDDMASDSATKVPTQQSVKARGDNRFAADRTALAGMPLSQYDAVYLREAGREGWFKPDGSDLSTYVTADTQQGIYVAPASDTTGASGAWVRQLTDGSYDVKWFGAVADGATDCTTEIQACADLAFTTGVQGIYFSPGQYIGYLELEDKTNFRIFGDGRQSAWLTTPNTAKPAINIFSNVSSGTTGSFSIENLRLRNDSTKPSLRVWNALHFDLTRLICYGEVSIQGSGNFVIDNCEAYAIYGGAGGLAIGNGALESAVLTNAGPGIVLAGQFQGTGCPGIYVQGDALGIDFIGTMYSALNAATSVQITGPATGTPRGSVNFWGCHGESNYNSTAGTGSDFVIGATYKCGHVGIYGGNYWGHGNGTLYHGTWIQLTDAVSVVINDVIIDALGYAHGFDSGVIYLAPSYTGAYDIRNVTNNAVGPTYLGFPIGSTYEGNVTNRTENPVERQAPTYANGWTDVGGTERPGGFYKDLEGVAHLEGAVTGGTAVQIFTLPVGYRPTANVRFAVSANDAFGEVTVDAGGGVYLTIGTKTNVYLDGVSFRAA